MRRESFRFWEDDPTVSLEAYIPDDGQNLPVIVVLPGGAYFALSEREGGQVAEHFAQRGFAAFVLRYSTMHPSFEEPYTKINLHTRFPEPMYITASAISLIRNNAGDFNADPDRICIMGFSAGGHLAANYCNEWNSLEVLDAIGASSEEIRPNACVLCYAATRLRKSSATMNLAVFGEKENYPDELLGRWCAAEHINRDTPPTFLWHTATDSMVPVSQSLEMAASLAEEGIPYEVHIFSEGDHASGLAEGMAAEAWKDLAVKFIERYT